MLLHPTGRDLSDLIARWHGQYAVHALHQPGGLIIFRIVRYDFECRAAVKDLTPVYVQPGETVALPVFEGPEGLSVRHEAYQLELQFFHLGPQVDSGHYQCAISVPLGRGSPQQWQYQICDARKQPRKARPPDLRTMAQNVYLVGLVRSY